MLGPWPVKMSAPKPPTAPDAVRRASTFLKDFQAVDGADTEHLHRLRLTDFSDEAESAMADLKATYGVAPLAKPDVVVLMDGWNKILAFQTSWREACFMRWRILAARDEAREVLTRKYSKKNLRSSLAKGALIPGPAAQAAEVALVARRSVESNDDPIAACLGSRLSDGREILLGLFDDAVRSMCPHSQTVARESYRPASDGRGRSFGMVLECRTKAELIRLLSACGVRPRHVVRLCEAFVWSMRTHNPYAGQDDLEDAEKKPSESVYGRFVADHVGRPAIKDGESLRSAFDTELYAKHLPRFWTKVKEVQRGTFGEKFYQRLLTDNPELLNYFARADMDHLASHISLAIDLMIKYPQSVGEAKGTFRTTVDHLGERHRELGIPTEAYPAIGQNIINTVRPFFRDYVVSTKWTEGDDSVTEEMLSQGFAKLYAATMSFTFFPMMVEEKMVDRATAFLEQVASELDWSPSRLSQRLLEARLEISKTGTYTHTSEEIQTGCRLAWRNSAKCIGRISWNTLMVRDCRHVSNPKDIVRELETHLKIATAGTNIQSVMTVFRPKRPNEAWGIKFWTEQLVRYAGYRDPDDHTKVLGDPANAEFTEFLIDRKLWTPPEPRGKHDVLPLVFKMPGADHPYVHEFDAQYIDEAPIEHPDCPGVADLGHRWAAVPIITTFNVNLGGVDYGAFPFNGWFASVEIVRDLMERYHCAEPWAEKMGIDVKSTRMYKTRIAHEVDRAVLHSFDKAGYTIVDSETAGEQFMTHCKREKEAGRECPSQWSWIGGLVGPTNVTWHKEMRDFCVTPQYEYCSEMWKVTGEDEVGNDDGELVEIGSITRNSSASSVSSVGFSGLEEEFVTPRVLIAYGSETGTAEMNATRLGRMLRILKPIVMPLNAVAGLDIVKERSLTHVIVLCSTFGSGKPPTNAEIFFDTDIPEKQLEDAKVAVLALGSSVYPDFCEAGKAVDRQLAAAGGTTMTTLTKADEAVDSASTIDAWLKLMKSTVLPESLEAAIEDSQGVAHEPPTYKMKWQHEAAGVEKTVKRFSWSEKESSVCLINQELLKGGDVDSRSTRRIVFDVPPEASYETGDHLSVHPLNSLEMVLRFASCFRNELSAAAAASDGCPILKKDYDGDDVQKEKDLMVWQLQQPFEIDCIDNGQVFPAQVCFRTPATLADVLQAHVSLSLSASSALDAITLILDNVAIDGANDSDGRLARLQLLFDSILEGATGVKGNEAVDEFLSLYPTIVDLLEAFHAHLNRLAATDGAALPLAHVLALLPRLQPRQYSISSSSLASPSRVEITVGVVHVHTKDGVHIKGVCSNYLARLRPGKDRVRLLIRQSNFRGPSRVDTPMIMVGAGTGLAPMMGFMEDRVINLKQKMESEREEACAGKEAGCHLFFGCRTLDERLYAEQIDAWESDKMLQFYLGLSRSPDHPKKYVQNLIKDHGPKLCKLLLREDCSYYVCGDANMSDNCYEAFIEVLREHGVMSRIHAVHHLQRMRVEGRWQYDLWGVSSVMEDYQSTKRRIAKKRTSRAFDWLAKLKIQETDDDSDLL